MSSKKNQKQNHSACPKCGSDAGNAAFCPDCGSKVRGASTDEKRARLEGKDSGGRNLLPILVVVAAVVLAVAGYAFFGRGGAQRPATVTAAPTGGSAAVAEAGITLPLTTFDDGKAHYYTWNSPSGKEVRFFVLKSADGVVRAAFDACDVCFASKKGYRQEGDYMVCNNCGQRFESVRVNEVRGGCNPSPVDRTFENGNLVITASALRAGEKYF